MITPLGTNAAQSCAALRAGISGFRQLEGIVDAKGNPVHAGRITFLEAGTAGDLRFWTANTPGGPCIFP
jgi:hypothetical protein